MSKPGTCSTPHNLPACWLVRLPVTASPQYTPQCRAPSAPPRLLRSDIAVGTHALISDSTQFKRLGLAVVDEQHK